MNGLKVKTDDTKVSVIDGAGERKMMLLTDRISALRNYDDGEALQTKEG